MMKPINRPAARFPHLGRWIVESGQLEIGPCPPTHSPIRVFDEAGMIWTGGTGELTWMNSDDVCITHTNRQRTAERQNQISTHRKAYPN